MFITILIIVCLIGFLGSLGVTDPTQFGKNLDDTTVANQGDDKIKTPQLDPKIIQALKESGAAEYHAKLASDPDFANLVKARQSGKKVKLVEEGAGDSHPTTTPSSQADPDFEKMSEKEKMMFIAQSAATIATTNLKKELDPINQKVDGLLQHSANIRRADIETNVEQARKSFPDFETYEPRMAQLASENKNLTVRQLYLLAKDEKGGLIPTSRLTSSERPSNSIARPHAKREMKAGVMGIREVLNASVASNLNRFQSESEE